MFVSANKRAIFSIIKILIYELRYIILFRNKIEVVRLRCTCIIGITYLIAGRTIKVAGRVSILLGRKITKISDERLKIVISHWIFY